MSSLYWLCEDQMARLRPYFPKSHHVPRVDDRRVLGDIVLLFSDESEALTHPYLAHAWARRGADLRAPAPRQSKKVAMMGSLEWHTRKLVVTTSRTKRNADFIAHLQRFDQIYGPKPGEPAKPVVIVLDDGPIHTSKASRAALAERAQWMAVE